VEVPDLLYNDGVNILYFNTVGAKGGSDSLKIFLRYLEESRKDNVVDDATGEIQDCVDTIKSNYKLGGRYMYTLGDWMDQIAAEAVEEKEAIIAEQKEQISELTALIEDLKKQLAEKK